jgi:hypothetical protein
LGQLNIQCHDGTDSGTIESGLGNSGGTGSHSQDKRTGKDNTDPFIFHRISLFLAAPDVSRLNGLFIMQTRQLSNARRLLK